MPKWPFPLKEGVLTPDEQLQIIETITENTSIRIACIVDDDSALEERMRTQLEAAEYAGMPQAVTAEETSTDFYKGNLRSGQVLESYSNITLIGDVSRAPNYLPRKLVILGSLKGNACAGAAGAGNCFIFALEMKPIQLQIGDLIAKKPGQRKEPPRTQEKGECRRFLLSPAGHRQRREYMYRTGYKRVLQQFIKPGVTVQYPHSYNQISN